MYRFICRAQIQRQHYMNEVDSDSFQYAHLQARTGGRPSQELMLINMVACFVQAPSPALVGVDEVPRALQGYGNAATSGYIL